MCEARRHNDEYHCHMCGYVWAIDDPDPPDCKPRPELVQLKSCKECGGSGCALCGDKGAYNVMRGEAHG